MTWAKLDDSFPWHPKVHGLSDRAFRIHVSAICYCATHRTNGGLNSAALGLLRGSVRARDWRCIVEELVTARLWIGRKNGFVIHDYLKYNPSRIQVESRQKAVAERVNKHRERTKNNHPVTPLQPDGGNPAPVPSRPVPSRTSKRSPEDPGSRRARRTTDPPSGEHAELVEHYEKAFVSARGEKPPWTGRDFKDLKKLREKHGLVRCKAFIDRAFADPFWRDKVTIRAIAEDPGRFVGNGTSAVVRQQSGVQAALGYALEVTGEEISQ